MAETVLRQAFATAPLDSGGDPARSAAYWLGAVLNRQGNGGEARTVWLTGLEAAAERGYLDIASAGDFVQSTFEDEASEQYLTAERVYRLVLETWGQKQSEEDAQVVDRAAAQTLLLMSREERDQVEAAPDPGQAFADWWVSQDPLPASELNERLVEHLLRAATATEKYSGRGATGWDDRGDLYVRLGPPSRTRTIDFYTPEFLRRLGDLRRSIRNSLLVEPSDFADNEVWTYQNVGPEGEEAQYLLVSDGSDYRVGQTVDLIPSQLRSGFDRYTGRGGAKADVVMEALRTIYRQLSTESMVYGQRYNDVEGYLSQLETVAFRAKAGGNGRQFGVAGAEGSGGGRADYSAMVQGGAGGGLEGAASPDAAVRSSLEVARREDEVIRARREEIVPPQSSQAVDRIAPLPLSVRLSRFLNERGETTLHIDWAPLAGGLAFSNAIRTEANARGYGDYRDAVLRMSLVRRPQSASRRVERREFVTVPNREFGGPDLRKAHSVQVDGEDGGGAIALQWDQYVAAIRPDSVALGPRVRVAVIRAEPPTPLRSAGLEISDLRPVRSVDQEPYPYRRVQAGEPISVYFEIYGLEPFGGAFTLEYQVVQRRSGSIFRRGRQETSEGRLISRVEGDRATEYLILNTAGWGEADEVEVQVSVRAGLEEPVERAIVFEVGSSTAEDG